MCCCTENYKLQVKYTHTIRNLLESKIFYMYQETNHTNNCLKIICIRDNQMTKELAAARSKNSFNYKKRAAKPGSEKDFWT